MSIILIQIINFLCYIKKIPIKKILEINLKFLKLFCIYSVNFNNII